MGQLIGNYAIEQRIGEGGMGSVFLAMHRVIGGRAAIKILQPQFARIPEMSERFLREARAAAQAEHPGIVKIFDFGRTPDGLPYMAMEYLDGVPLSKHIAAYGQLPLEEALSLGQQLAAALAAAHRRGVIHRDLKPENIILLKSDDSLPVLTSKIVDFGIARIDTPLALQKLTRTGAFLGTPCYMAPEVVRDPRTASDRSDVYALGVILYQMLVGEVPFSGESIGQVVLQHLTATPPDLTERVSGAPARLCSLVRRMLAKKPQDRPTMKIVGRILRQIEQASAAHPVRRALLGSQIERSHGRQLLTWFAPSTLVGIVALGSSFGLRHPRTPLLPREETAKPSTSLPTALVLTSPSKERSALSDERARGRVPAVKGIAKAKSHIEPAPKITAAENKQFIVAAVPASSACVRTLRNPFHPECSSASATAQPEPVDPRQGARRYLLDAGQFRAHGDLRTAIAKSRQAAAVLPVAAWSFVGALGCEMHDFTVVREAYGHVVGAQRQCLDDMCQTFGVQRRGDSWSINPALRRGINANVTELALQDARQAYQDHLWDRAIEQASVALKGSHYAAHHIIGRAACMKGDLQLARQSLCRLDPLRQADVQAVCRANGTELVLQ